MIRGILSGIGAGAVAAAAIGQPPGDAGSKPSSPGTAEPVKARLVSERVSITPGQTALLGVSLQLAPGWHVYWDGTEAGGMAPAVSLTLPKGYTAGPIRWPVPTRMVTDADATDEIYEKQVTLVIPVTAPLAATAGDKATFSAKVEWFVCSEMCMSGGTTVDLSLSVSEKRPAPPDATRDAPLFSGPFPKPALPDWVKPSWSARRLTLTVAPPAGAPTAGQPTLIFHPARDCAPLEDPVHHTQVTATTMTLTAKPSGGDQGRIRGILEIRWPGAQPAEAFNVDRPVPKSGAGS